MRVPVTAALLLLFSALCSSPAFAQREERSEEIRLKGDLKHYQGMVAAYRQGNDHVVVELLTWDRARLGKTVAAINSIFDPNAPWSDAFLRAGTVLQTTVALRWLDDGDDSNALVHLNLAIGHLRRASPANASFAGRFYYAVSRLFLSVGDAPRAEYMLESARSLVPSDPLVLYASGTMAEMRATQWQSAPAGMRIRSLTDTEPFDHVLKNRVARLQNAYDWLRGAVESMPTPLARLHLARVLMMRRSDREALDMLADLRTSSNDRATRYLALLFAGAIHERAGRLGDAANAYSEAVACFEEAQVAYIALSQALQASGKGDQARAVLRDLLKSPRDGREPWSWYFMEPVNIARERLSQVIEEGRR
jgi:tetratricopeptide (TPR) repeat protein